MAITIDFKNVGSEFDRGTSKRPTTLPIGIKTPIRRGSRFGVFDMHTDAVEQIKDNLKNLILTNHGERVMFTDYGADLRSILFMMVTELTSDVVSEIAVKIKDAADKYMPYIVLERMEITHSSMDPKLPTNYARIRIGFQVPGITMITGHAHPTGRSDVANELDLFLNLG